MLRVRVKVLNNTFLNKTDANADANADAGGSTIALPGLRPGELKNRTTTRVILHVWSYEFWLAWTKSRKSYCTTTGVGVGVGIGGVVGVSKMLKFYVKVFYMMGKALSSELSCPSNRFCYDTTLSTE